ncbi:hypothetical protein U9M48_000749 [Paspalum notatum var. saurae]|uniref:Protein kinase domain-containing protein n=1 Tax=Paspalum notatum var. saurae TaxID=547442 RepID=A0AAQ3SG62_PASNO
MNQGLLFRRGLGKNDSTVTLQPGSLGYYMGNSSQLNSTDSGWFVIPKWFDPWKQASRHAADDSMIDLQEASFTIVFTLSVAVSATTSTSVLLFDILPRLEPSPSYAGRNRRLSVDPVSITTLGSTTFHSGKTIRVTTRFEPPRKHDLFNPNPDPPALATYSVRVSYDHAAHNLSAYIASDAAEVAFPNETSMQLDDRDALSPDALLFALSSTMGQLLQLHTWNFTIEVPVAQHSQRANMVTILSSVLGSAAATAAIATAVYVYLNSKYRRWKKDLDQLARSMQRLPGVPMKVDFADIKKSTGNFDETTRLGQGGFGAVYRCRLPAPAPQKGGEFVEVAVKVFTRGDNRRYEDLLAEVSIINRLRHKNIVPLVGWSYNRGEPILIYEYMPNGSLDELLFHRKGGGEQQPTTTSICQWGTRYNIVKDIATGLHYVHHEYEPMVLHRDIKASNILIDLTFQARLGDFGLACVLADGKNSYTDQGAPGTMGFRAPEYIYSGKATRKTDVFAFGVLVLEIVTGRRAVGRDVQQFGGHVMDWVWHLHVEGNLLAAVDAIVLTAGEFDAREAVCLLLLGMACCHSNPSDRPTMEDVVRIISKSVPPPDVPLSKPPLMWPPEGWTSADEESTSSTTHNLNRTSTFMVETTTAGSSREHIASENVRGGRMLLAPPGHPRGRSSQEAVVSVYHTARAS